MENSFSVWQKVDLHIHTDWSKKTKDGDYQGVFSVQLLHEKLVENDVKIFSLTDHNIINVPAYKEYYKLYKSDDDPLLLLGIELDIEGKKKLYHSLLIFNYWNSEKVEIINEKLENIYQKRGCDSKQRKLDFDALIKLFPTDDFFFIPHAGNVDKSIIDGYKGHITEAQKMLILLQSPMEKVDAKRRQIYNDGFDKLLVEKFKHKDDYAYIEFSDNHNIEKYPCLNKGDTGIHSFYYIKGSKNYETLRLAFIDPKSRIKSQEEYSKISSQRNFIESIQLRSSPVVKEKTLFFSPHLNVIIGGRSSGKSLLLDILSRCIDNTNVDKKYDKFANELDLKIKSNHDDSYKNITSIDSTIIQIKQGDIINYFENKRLEELAKKTGKINEYNQKRTFFGQRKNEIEDRVKSLCNQYKNLYDLQISRKYVLHDKTIKNSLSDEYLFLFNLDELEKNLTPLKTIEDNEGIISNLESGLEKFIASRYFNFTQEEGDVIRQFEEIIRSKKEILTNDKIRRKRFDLFMRKVKSKIDESNLQLNSEGQNKAQAVTAINNIAKDAKKVFTSLFSLHEQIEEIKKASLKFKEEINLDEDCKLCLEVSISDSIENALIDGIKNQTENKLYPCILELLLGKTTLKNLGNNSFESFTKKCNSQLLNIYSQFDDPIDYLEYNDGSNSKNNSPGYNSEKYLQVILNNAATKLIIIDQPEDNLGNKFISESLVNLIRNLKFSKQLFLVTHNPAIVVYGDAEAIILAKNEENIITYDQIKLEDETAQKEICSILDGGEYIFDNRAKKYNIQKLLHEGE